ncbi:SDR family oxidoreductase [Streptosporangium canum]|uniref:SDR family oxidoreductase n=1 Tax=Streptosporangium canum TaxID=324952 RepID=UPI00344AC719
MSSVPVKTAIVTGVSRRIGIGYAIARRLASAPMNVFACSWSPHDADQDWGADPLGAEGVIAALRDELPESAGRIEHLAIDLADPAAPGKIVAAARERFGRVDVLVANHARSAEAGIGELTADELDLCWAVNVRATLLLVQEFAAQADLDGGRIVTFTSGQHLEPMPTELPYSVTKGAIQQMTISLAAPLAARGITVNCVNPGPVDTGYASPEDKERLSARHPQGRWGTPEETAGLVRWLVGDETSWITGQTIVSDGGWSLRNGVPPRAATSPSSDQ